MNDDDAGEMFPWLGRLLQVGDSAFPTGGYAHSYGFEQVVQSGQVHDAASMDRYLECHLWPMLIHFELPVVCFARKAAREGNLDELLDLDACVDATKTARELREASRVTGRRRLHSFTETSVSSILEVFTQAVEQGRSPAHHTVVYGVGLAGIPERALLISWAYQSLGAVCLSSPKLLRIGQNAAQRVLTSALAHADEKVDQSLAVARDDLGWFDPLVEIASMHHEIAHERLFIS